MIADLTNLKDPFPSHVFPQLLLEAHFSYLGR